MKKNIENIIINTLKDLSEEFKQQAFKNPTPDTLLFGKTLDSLSLVLFITELEERISDELNEDIVLADERAMSQTTSPFRSVKTLTSYIETLLKDSP